MSSLSGLSPHLQLRRDTLALLHRGYGSSTLLSHLIGRWVWVMLLRRPSLAVLQHIYRWLEVARGPHFEIWPSVRRELCTLLDLQPLLSAQIGQPMFHRVIASDASEFAAGVVASVLTPAMNHQLWPLCSSRHAAALQTQLGSDAAVRAIADAERTGQRTAVEIASARMCLASFEEYYATVGAAPWSTLISRGDPLSWSGHDTAQWLQ